MRRAKESARLWNFCVATHIKARKRREKWPTKDCLQREVKGGGVSPHSQTAQMIIAQFLATVETACQIEKQNRKIRLPYHEKHFYPLMWPKQAVKVQKGRLLLPMGKGRSFLILPMNTEKLQAGACTIVWKNGYELYLVDEQEEAAKIESDIKATVDLGEIYLATVVTGNGRSVVISGRKIRAEKRLITQAVAKTAKKRQRCHKRSRKSKELRGN